MLLIYILYIYHNIIKLSTLHTSQRTIKTALITFGIPIFNLTIISEDNFKLVTNVYICGFITRCLYGIYS